MPRPKCCRTIGGEPPCRIFKPAEVPRAMLEEIILTMDEFEAIRLADLENLYHEQAAARMNVSRQTFGRIIEEARGKVARVLVEGLALRIAEGEVKRAEQRTFRCHQCQHSWSVPFGIGKPEGCPGCKSENIARIEGERGEERSGLGCRRNKGAIA